jgi:hypothetical protein
LPRVFCCSPYKFLSRWHPVFILFSNCPKVMPKCYIFLVLCVFGLERVFKISLIFPVIWRNFDIVTVNLFHSGMKQRILGCWKCLFYNVIIYNI